MSTTPGTSIADRIRHIAATDPDPARKADMQALAAKADRLAQAAAPVALAEHVSAGIGGQECPSCGEDRCACTWSAA